MRVSVVLTVVLVVSSPLTATATAAPPSTSNSSATEATQVSTEQLSTRAVVSSITAAPSSATDGDAAADRTVASPRNDSSVLVDRTVTYRRTPENRSSIEVDVSYEVDPSVDRLCMILYTPYSTVTTNGFEHEPEQAGCLYEWNRPAGTTSIATPSVTFRVKSTIENRGGYEAVERSEWALVPAEIRTYFYSPAADGALRFVDDPANPRTASTYRVAGKGVAVDGMVFLGDATVDEWQTGGETLRFVRPAVVRGALPPRAVRRTLRSAARDLSIGGRDGPVTIVAGPNPLRGGGVAPGPNAAWVHHDSSPHFANNVWVHEYVHTRQDWILGEDVHWFTEASAEYYAALATYRQGAISYWSFREHVATDEDSRVVLADSESAGFDGGEYTKGARVAAALDHRIRRATGGNRSLADVLYLVNHHEGVVSFDDFVTIVERVSGTSQRSWLERYVQTSAVPEVPTSSEWLVETPPDRDADGDGVTESVEKRAGLDPFATDTDDDGLSDDVELERATDPAVADTDDDGLGDGREATLGSDPIASDSDADGLDDGTEVVDEGTDPLTNDTDGDGLPDGEEATTRETSPTNADTDDDGLDDATEVASELFDATSPDIDGDGLLDGREHALGTNPMRSDTDGDGVADDVEVNASTNPLSNDTDGDGLVDAVEFEGETNATNADSDGDGITDGEDDEPLVAPTTTTSASTTSAADDAPGAAPGFTLLATVLALLVVLGARSRSSR